MHFEFATATRIVFGPGKLREAGTLAWELGRRALLMTGRNAERAAPLTSLLAGQGIPCAVFSVSGEPTIEQIEQAVKVAREGGCDFVVSIGGGSALDAGKATAAMMANPGELLDYLEVIGKGRPLARPSVPFMAVPTTAGTGSEVTRNAVLGSHRHRVKASLRSPLMLPRIALIDPELTFDLPRSITASTGLDAITQLIEPYVCRRANPMTDALCVEGIQRASRFLRRAYANGRDARAREEMALASLWGGLALANAGLGAVHGFAAPIGGMFPAPHGAVCAALLPHVTRVNVRALRLRAPESEALQRYEQIARWVLDDPTASANDAASCLDQLVSELGIPSLATYGIGREHFDDLIEKAGRASSMKANPIALEPGELREILERAC